MSIIKDFLDETTTGSDKLDNVIKPAKAIKVLVTFLLLVALGSAAIEQVSELADVGEQAISTAVQMIPDVPEEVTAPVVPEGTQLPGTDVPQSK